MQDVGREHHTKNLRDTADRVTPVAIARQGLRLFPAGTLLVPKSGASVNLNHRALLGVDAYVVSHLATIVPMSGIVDPEYLYYWSLTYDPRHQAQTTSLPSLPTSLIKSAVVPVRPIAEQRQIVDILSRADNIVRMRKEAEQKAKEIIPALFLNMFGDPATNPKRWDAAKLGDVGTLDRGRSRHRPRNAPHLLCGPYPFVQTGDVANSRGRIRTHQSTYSEAGLAQSRMWPKGTLCITIAANIAATGVLDFDACFPDSVVGFVPGSSVRTEYIQAWLGFLQPMLEAQAPQAAQKNINLQILRELRVPLPPIDLQERFASLVEAISDVKGIQSQALSRAHQAFESLLAKVFGEG